MLARWRVAYWRWRRRLRHRRKNPFTISRRITARASLGVALGLVLSLTFAWVIAGELKGRTQALAYSFLTYTVSEGFAVRDAVTGWLSVSPSQGVALLQETLPTAPFSDMEGPIDFGWQETLRRWVYQASGYDLAQPKTLLTAGLPRLEEYEQNVLHVAGNSSEASVISEKPDRLDQQELPQPLLEEDEEEVVSPDLAPVWGNDPLVFVYHTHTAEMYLGSVQSGNSKAHSYNTVETGVVRVGAALARTLNETYGIPVLHSLALHDWPDYGAAYLSSERTIRDTLEKYPSIQVVIDVHRDGAPGDISYVRQVSGQEASQVMVVVGKPEGASNRALHPKWQENLGFAQALANKMKVLYPGLLRLYQGQSVNQKVNFRLNQHLHPNAVLLEIGTVMDDEAAAIRSATLMADVVAAMLVELAMLNGGTSPVRPSSPAPVPRPEPVVPQRAGLLEKVTPPSIPLPTPKTRIP